MIMKTGKSGLPSAPKFVTGRGGRTRRVSLETEAYVTLLIRANITEPTLWPPGLEKGAALLARIRQIEQRCIRKHGEFDWEKLSPRLQDEYDGTRVDLDRMLDTGEPKELNEFLRKHDGRMA